MPESEIFALYGVQIDREEPLQLLLRIPLEAGSASGMPEAMLLRLLIVPPGEV
jgi:hypothetical protein